jgi:hypothetical protein
MTVEVSERPCGRDCPFLFTGYRLTGGGPSGVLPGARELCPVSGAGFVAVGM